jgi:transposase
VVLPNYRKATIIMTAQRQVVIGVDTHADTHTAAAVDELGRILDVIQVDSTPAGHRRLLHWARRLGCVERAGIEGTGAYGAGLARFLTEHNIAVIEVNRTNRQHRRRRGKSDPADAEAAARAVLSGEATCIPKDSTGRVEAIRVLHLARRSAVKAKTQAGNQISNLVLTAPEPLRAQLRSLTTAQRVRLAAKWRPRPATDPATATKTAIRSLARRWLALHDEIRELEQQLKELLEATCPSLLAEQGVGLDVAAKLVIAAGENPDRLRNEATFAALCGVSPVDASSGKQARHRLNRGGNRQANNALHTVVLIRASRCPETRAYIERRRTEGRSNREIWRCLKRALARRFHQHLVDDLTPVLT